MTTTNWDKLQESLEGLRADCPKGFTSEEFADSTGCCRRLARERINALIKAKKAKFVGNKSYLRMDGKPSQVPVYDLVGNKSR